MNFLVTGAWKEAEKYIPILKKMGHSVAFLQYEKDPVPCVSDWAEGIICNGLFLHHSIENFVNLKYIQLTSAGFDRVPMDYVRAHNIIINNARGVYSIPMAEFALAGVLFLYKKLFFFADNQKTGVWEKNRSLWELWGKTVLVLGCGSVGSECAKRFSAMGCRVLGCDIFPYENPAFEKIYNIEKCDALIGESDIIIVTLPLTETTEKYINGYRLSLMKDTSVLVNISRGRVIDEKALEKYSDRIGGAVLDVFEEEPLSQDSPLWTKENILITPHNSFVSENNDERLSRLIISNLEKE